MSDNNEILVGMDGGRGTERERELNCKNNVVVCFGFLVVGVFWVFFFRKV